MPNLSIYAILGVIILGLLGGFYWYYKSTEAEKAVLIEAKAKLELVVKTQIDTIKNMKASAELIIKSNTELSNDLLRAEENAAKEKSDLDKEDIQGLNEQEIEKKINEEYIRNNRSLESMY